jgi:2-dehydropantoate 2-reductase
MRYIILGAGGVGCSIGGLLQHAGARVSFIARGAQLAALRERGLDLATPGRLLHLAVDAHATAAEAGVGGDDVVILCTKSFDTAAAVESLPAGMPVVCAQNGVANESLVRELGAIAYGAMVWAPAEFLSPGRVNLYADGSIVDVGLFPTGSDARCERIVEDLSRAGFGARVDSRIERTKWGKLVQNLANAIDALAGRGGRARLAAAVSAEGARVLEHAGIDYARQDELDARCKDVRFGLIDGAQRSGGSTWQSLARGAGGRIETTFFNGEIVRLAEKTGTTAPLNAALDALALRAAREGWPPGKLSVAELEAMLGAS